MIGTASSAASCATGSVRARGRAAVAALVLLAATTTASFPDAFAQGGATPPAAPPAPAPVVAAIPATASGPAVSAAQAEQLLRSERFRHLAAELRCLVCQNQSLADSNADLAVDLRNEVLRQMAAGRDDAQIKQRLVERYGEFVLYRPAFSARNLALWLGPAVLLAIGGVVLWRMSRRRPDGPAPTPGSDIEARLARVDRLLDEGDTVRRTDASGR